MQIINITGSLIACILILVSAVIVVKNDWKDRLNLCYAYYSLSAFGILFSMLLTYSFNQYFNITLLNKITQASTLLFFASIILFSLVFPKTEKKISGFVFLIILMPVSLFSILILATDFTIKKAYFSDGQLIREYNYYIIYFIFAFVLLTLGISHYVWKYKKSDIYIHKLQMRYIFFGSAGAILFGTMCSMFLPLFFNYYSLYVIGPVISSAIVTFVLFYSISAHNLMDIRTIFHKSMTYFFISALIIMPVIITALFHKKNMVTHYLTPVLASLGLSVYFSFKIQPLIDRLFKRKIYLLEDRINIFIKKISTVEKQESVIKNSTEMIYNTIYPEAIFFMIYSEENDDYRLFASKGIKKNTITLSKNDALVKRLAKDNQPLLRRHLYTDNKNIIEDKNEIITFYQDNNINMIFPLYFSRSLYGFICIADKKNTFSYTTEEIELLSRLIKEINGFLSYSMIYSNLAREELNKRNLNLTSEIISHCLPESAPQIKNIKISAFYISGYGGGKEFFDFINLSDFGIGAIITEVGPIRIKSAIRAVIIKAAIRASINSVNNTGKVVSIINLVLQKFNSLKPASIFYLFFNSINRRLAYTNAGFSPLELYTVNDGSFQSLETQGENAGADPNTQFGTGSKALSRGDIGFLYTKSIVKAKNNIGDEFGLIRLRNIVKDNRNLPVNDIAQAVKNKLQHYISDTYCEDNYAYIIFKIN